MNLYLPAHYAAVPDVSPVAEANEAHEASAGAKAGKIEQARPKALGQKVKTITMGAGEEKWGSVKLVLSVCVDIRGGPDPGMCQTISGMFAVISPLPELHSLYFVRTQAWTKISDSQTPATPFAPLPIILSLGNGLRACPSLRTIYTLPGLPSSGLDLFSRLERSGYMAVTGRFISYSYLGEDIASARLLSDAVPILWDRGLDLGRDGDDVRPHSYLLRKAAWQTFYGGYRDVRVPAQVMLRMYELEGAGLDPAKTTGRGWRGRRGLESLDGLA